MSNAQNSEANHSLAPKPDLSEARKKVFIACIHRPGFDSCVPNCLIHKDAKGWNRLSDYSLQRNWPLLKIIGCFESEREARAAVDVSFCAMKTEGIVDPRASLYKMRYEYHPFVAWPDDDSEDLDDDTSDDERIPYEKACDLVELQKGPTLWSIFPFDMPLTHWALPQVFIASGQFNAACCCSGSDEEIVIFGAFQGAAEARAKVDSKKKNLAHLFLGDCDESDEDDVSLLPSITAPPKDFLSTLLIPDKDITENWHADGTGCTACQIWDHQAHSDCGIDRVSLRVQKVPNVPASKPITLLALVKSFRDTLAWLQLCNLQGVPLFSFVQVSPRVSRPFAGSRVYGMMLMQAERLRVVGCGFKGELVRLLSLGDGRHSEPQRNWGACRKMMQSITRRVAAGLAASVDSKFQSKKRKRAMHDLE